MRLLPPMLLLVALAGCGGGGRDGGSGDASSPPPRSTPAAQPTAPSPGSGGAPLRLGVLGDSYSNGEAVGLERSWPAVMAAQLTQEGLPIEIVANPSVTGATTAEMLDTGLPPIRAARPDVMTVMLGVNDQVQGRSIAQFEADEDRALQAAIEITGSAQRVIAVDIPDYSPSPAAVGFGDPAAIAKQIDDFNGVVRKVAARRGVRLVSIVGISRRLGADGISGDGLHPSAGQLAEWAEQIGAVARTRWAPLRDSRG